MQQLVEKVLKKTKKPITLDSIYIKVENLMKKENKDFVLTEVEKEEINSILKQGLLDYKFIHTGADKYISISKTSFKTGHFYGDRDGGGKVIVTNSYTNNLGNPVVKEERYIVDRDNAHGAIDGDMVLIDTYKKDKSKYFTASVTKIINRDLDNIIGEVVKIGNSYYVKPVDKKKHNITIALEDVAIEGQRVSVSLGKKTNDNFYIGTIIRTFNHKDDPEDDILWEAFKCGINDQFSNESLEQVKTIPQRVLDIDKIGRHDLTDWEIFTIDGEDTKDIDDALSCKKLDNGNYLVGVHIADVSHYVLEGSSLDKDAFYRGTSVYLAGKVIPMLPHELSNGICSLNPNEERLAISCIMEVNNNGEVIKHNIWKSVIKSNIKMNYDAVNDILKYNIIADGYESHVNSLKSLNELAIILRNNRIKEGSIEFNRPELKVILDDDGIVKDFSTRVQDLAENLIEEFMLLANETIDKHLSNHGLPCLHRVHDIPSKERLEEFMNLLSILGYKYKKYGINDCCYNSNCLQDLANYIKSTGRLSDMLSTNMIRCMSRAKYSPVNIGHSGLAKSNYCHFTSPIRRYPDLTIHRILKDLVLSDENIEDNKSKWKDKLPEIALQSSKMERAADEAEMQTLYMKCAEYMSHHICEDFVGTVIGISGHGLQIQLDNYIEGRVRFRNLVGKYFYNPDTYSLISLDGREDYYIGDRLSLKVKSADKEHKTIDFSINSKLEESKLDNAYEKNNLVKIKVAKDRRNKGIYGIS